MDTLPDFAAVRSILSNARTGGRAALSEPEAKALLRLAGIPTPPGGVARNPAEAKALAARLGPPLALKIVSPEILHKSDVGGVELNVPATNVETAYGELMRRVSERLPRVKVDGILVEEMVAGGVEAVASVTRHPQLGPVLMVGMGGLWVELLSDVSFRLVPVDRWDAEEMLAELKGAALLGGVRGRAPADREALAGALLRLGELAQELGEELGEVEINPLAVLPRGVCAIDALIRAGGA
jgi:acyl-CoA synthetase (NDP forming)